MTEFEYPTEPHSRRHGPSGYQNYNSFRDWLRDEFMFRCVYCLHREQWCDRGAMFHIDHYIPAVEAPQLVSEYSNLLYSCARCNEAKKAIIGLPDPCQVAFHDCLRILEDGSVEALNSNGESLLKILRLNSRSSVRYRSSLIRTFAAIELTKPEVYQEWMRFPDDLPDLRLKKVPSNSKPEGAANCFLALRERGQLPAIY